jgi:hypothetical protein
MSLKTLAEIFIFQIYKSKTTPLTLILYIQIWSKETNN